VNGSLFQASSILLVEDNLADVRLTVELLREAKLANRLKVVGNGLEAYERLLAAARDPADQPPDLVILDLDLPGLSGRDLLHRMREEPLLRHTCVFLLTASVTHAEMVADEGLPADGYLTKPIDLSAFVREVCRLDRFWLELVCAPAPG
jgi:CheY-like chemotaxis protein